MLSNKRMYVLHFYGELYMDVDVCKVQATWVYSHYFSKFFC